MPRLVELYCGLVKWNTFKCGIFSRDTILSFVVAAVLLWLFTAACIKTGRPQIARRAIELVESRLSRDSWPEYYDGKIGRYIGKQARKFQTWSIAGYLVAKMMLEDPSHLGMIALEEDKQMRPPLRRSASWTFWSRISVLPLSDCAPPHSKVFREERPGWDDQKRRNEALLVCIVLCL